jgi:hypothetical protein
MLRIAVPVAVTALAVLAGAGGRGPQQPLPAQTARTQPVRIDLSTLAGRRWVYHRLLADGVKPG